MLAYIPVRFDLYRQIRAPLRWTMQCLVAFADKAGQCWPSVRKLAEVAGLGKSTVSRHLAELAREGRISRVRKPGGVYSYRIDSAFLPAQKGCPARRAETVPPAPREENPGRKEGDSNWEARLRGWRRRRFWLAWWGPKPSEPGCWVPAGLLGAQRGAAAPAG